MGSVLALAAVEVELLDEFGQELGVIDIVHFPLHVHHQEALQQVDLGTGQPELV